MQVMDWPGKTRYERYEHIWDQMATHIRDMDSPRTTQQRLRDAVIAAWDALRPERLGS